jgi:hypothetical protein
MLLRRSWILGAAMCATVAAVFAGGFFLTVHGPGDIKDAVLTVQAEGCQDYSQASITGRAEGIVDGKRQSVAVDLTPTSKPGVYAVRKQWPAEGKWVLVLSGTAGDRHTHTIVQLAPDGRVSKTVRLAMGPVSPADVDAALRSVS